jgi:hypothetical protein
MSAAAITALTAEIKSLKAEMTSLREAVLARPAPAKASKAKTAKDPDAPKQEPTWWIKATQHVRETLKAQIEADNAALVAEGGKKQAGTVPVRVASMLKAAGKLSADAMPEDEEIFEAYETFKTDPPEPKMPALREAAAAKKAGSVASSTASSAGSKGTKFADMTEEEQKAARKARAIKAAATRAANKAAKEAAEAAEAEASESEEEAEETPKPAPKAAAKPSPKKAAAAAEPAPEPIAVAEAADAVATTEESPELVLEAKPWKGNIGKGQKNYERIDHDGKAYIYTTEGEYQGVWDEKAKKLDKKAKDISAA